MSLPRSSHLTSRKRKHACAEGSIAMDIDRKDPKHQSTKATRPEARRRAPASAQDVAGTAKRSRSSSTATSTRSSGADSSASLSQSAAKEPGPPATDHVDELMEMIRDIKLEEKRTASQTRAAKGLSISDAITNTLRQEQDPRRCILIFRSCIKHLLDCQRTSGGSFSKEIRVLEEWIERMEEEIRDERARETRPSSGC
ncbi:hypothetical protein GJ744_007832 [Endocarpon pusillum]|uniref:Uncharacterized protein n=1 Tax=Endocarpon pusillum TaxID=364733 RepID=A0A8H7AV81_9EURO|nr:hypothetical protein GJ744_007832 [Endocarpon pusillum]